MNCKYVAGCSTLLKGVCWHARTISALTGSQKLQEQVIDWRCCAGGWGEGGEGRRQGCMQQTCNQVLKTLIRVEHGVPQRGGVWGP